MPRYVALLRGVNVGPNKRVPMAEWRTLLTGLGYTGVQTLLNSGNAVFDAKAAPTATIASRIREAILDGLELDVPVIVKSAAEFQAIVDENVLAAGCTNDTRLMVSFGADTRVIAPLAGFQQYLTPPEAITVTANALYLWCPNGVLESKVAAALLGRQGQNVTTRNWATVKKIAALLA
ncbi:MAG: DUF1697 domain-containing protein [Gemmatimonadaceae bacterium]|nr:DUF1697 domain-containing protein [Gemmatimonadaceae bacterium]